MTNYVYVVWYYDGGEWEDARYSVERIFSSWDEAEEYILKKKDYKKNNETWLTFDFNVMKSIRINRPCWVNKDPELFDDFWIEIYDLDTGRKVPYDNKHIFLFEKKDE